MGIISSQCECDTDNEEVSSVNCSTLVVVVVEQIWGFTSALERTGTAYVGQSTII